MKKTKEFIRGILMDLAGGFLVAVGVYNFAAYAGLPLAGVNGIALICYHYFHVPIGTVAVLLNIPIILGTARILGLRFYARSVQTILISAVLMDYVAPLLPVYQGERLLAVICCGVLSGIGYALIFMAGSSSGGTDFIMLAVQKKRPFLSLGNITFVLDTSVIALNSLLVGGDIDSFIYGILQTFVLSMVLDKILYGTDQGKVSLVVTDKGEEMCRAINHRYERGATLLQAKGGYTGEDRDVVMCACNTKQMYGIRRLIKEVDPHSFLVIMESSDVVGEGFKSE